MNDATECQEAPRVALSDCQGYYCFAVTPAKERERVRKEEEEEEEDRR